MGWWIFPISHVFNHEGNNGINLLWEFHGISILTQMLHVWYIYLQNWVIYGVNVGKYSSTMEYMGLISPKIEGRTRRAFFWRNSSDIGRPHRNSSVDLELTSWFLPAQIIQIKSLKKLSIADSFNIKPWISMVFQAISATHMNLQAFFHMCGLTQISQVSPSCPGTPIPSTGVMFFFPSSLPCWVVFFHMFSMFKTNPKICKCHTGWGPPVISRLITPSKYCYKYHTLWLL